MNAPPPEPPGASLEIRDEPAFQRLNWFFQRTGWVLMALVLLAAGLGLFGRGVLATTRAGVSGGPLWIDYERFARNRANTEWRLHFRAPADAAPGDTVTVRIHVSEALLHTVRVVSFSPPPVAAVAEPGGVVWVFRSVAGGPLAARVIVQPETWGWVRGAVRLENGPTVEMRQLIYP